MARAYSLDLRERVVAAVAGGESCRKVAGIYKVSVASVVKWSQRFRATGSAAAKRMGGNQPRSLAGERGWVDILIMDEPTSSLDELSQFKIMEYMRDLLPNAMVIHAGHRPGLERFHDREIELVHEKFDGPATTQEQYFAPLELVSRALRKLGRGRSA